MSEIKPIFDNRPIYLGSDGFPLIYGKLKFFDIGTTNPKAVYRDYERNTSAGVEVILDNVGRSETQLFAGEGDYSVYSYKFNGTDPLTAEESEWSLDNEWVQNGCTAITSNGTTLAIVNTISDLRDLSQAANSVALVLGYYDAGDRQPIIYHLKTNADSDNGGTIIKNPSIFGKSWIYAPEGQAVNASIFGLIPSDTAFKNSLLASACAYCYLANKTLYIPKGLYYFETGNLTVNCDVIIDDSVTFRCDLGNYVINIYKHFDIRLTNDIKNSMSTGDVYFQFQKNCEGSYIDASWFGANYDNSTNCGAAFEKTVLNVIDNSIPIRISGQARITSLSADIEFKNDILFENEGFIRNSQTAYNIVFNSIELINNSPLYKRSYVLYAENLSKYKLKNIANIRASLFEYAGAISDPITLDLSQYINNFQVEGNRVQFILDVKRCSFISNIQLSKGANYDIVCESGLIYANGSSLYFNSVVNPEYGYFISSGIFVSLNGETKYKWFKADEATTVQQTIALNLSILSASYGNGILNLDNESISIRSTVENIPYTKGSANLEIKNGSIYIDYTGCYFLPMISSNYNTLKFKNVIFNTPPGVESGLINAKVSTYIYNLYFDDCIFSSGFNDGSCKFINITDTSQIINLRIRNSFIQSSYLIGGTLSGLNDSILENSNLVCNVNVNGTSGTKIENCNIGSNNINLYSKNGFLKGFVRGCTATTGSVNIIAEQSDVEIQGLNVSNNAIPNVYLLNGAGTFSASYIKHFLIVENNHNENGYSASTKGYGRLATLYKDIPTYSQGDIVTITFAMPSSMLTLPNGGGAGRVVFVGSLLYLDRMSQVARDFTYLGLIMSGSSLVFTGLAIFHHPFDPFDQIDIDFYFESFKGTKA